MTIKVTTFSDPGHGWVRLSRSQFEMMPLELRQRISACSYVSPSGRFFYLEEDCDAGIFFDWAKAQGHEVKQRAVWTNNRSKIRNLYSVGVA